ncbi:MAG: FtsX-like permease family protein [Alistipes sp.]|nr:FtsX-like permease family protein [Alistipes sp.]
MKIAFRNFLTTLKRYKTASILNIAGLTMAFMALYILISQVVYEVSFNRSIKEHERIYLLAEKVDFDGEISVQFGRYTIERLIAQCPEIEAGGTVRYNEKRYQEKEQYVWAQRGGYQLERFTGIVYPITMSMLDIFSFQTVEGDLKQMERPNTIIISRSEAKRLGVGVGDLLFIPYRESGILEQWSGADKKDDAPDKAMEIVGIFEDFAPNSIISQYKILRNIGDFGAAVSEDGMHCFPYFVKLHEGVSTENIINVYCECIKEANSKSEWGSDYTDEEFRQIAEALQFIPLAETYYTENDVFKSGSRSTMKILVGVVMLIVIMAFINFVNFFFALIPMRIRVVNISKVFGASIGELRWSFLFEAIGLVVCAILLTLYLAVAFIDFPLTGYVTCSLNPFDNLTAIGIILAIGVVMAIVVALYPAWYITSFSPSLAAKGRFAGSVKGRKLRLALIFLQFTISTVLITTTIFFGLQYRYMINFDIGFDTENLITFRASNNLTKHNDVFTNKLKQHSDIEDVATSNYNILIGSTYWLPSHMRNEVDIETVGHVNTRDFSPNMLRLLGIKLIEGEWMTEADYRKQVVIVDKRMVERFDLKLGDFCAYGNIKGIIENVNFNDVSEEQRPTFIYNHSSSHRQYYVRLQPTADVGEVVEYINSVAHEIDPHTEFVEVEMFDDVIAQQYEKTKRTMIIVGAFALVAIVISLMGVFGIVLFETQHRRREIAIRKVFGSTTSELLWLLNSRYAKIVCACFVVAAPVAWWVTSRWLEQFASRIPIYWWVFAVAFILVMGITIGLVTLRSWHAANENPADVVKSE